MVILAPLSRSSMEANHARAAARLRKKVDAMPKVQSPFNVEIVLDLGNIVFFHFRGRAYGMPPLPWAEGQRLMKVWLEASQHTTITKDNAQAYFAALRQIPPILWRNCYPSSKLLRIMRRLGLMKNPFKSATEQELGRYASFFLARRMRSGESNPPVVMAARLSEATL